MNIQVVYQNNSSGQIDSSLLDSMVADHKVLKFMRSDGWVSADQAHLRGEGVDRRGIYGLTGEMRYKIVA